MTSVEGVMNHVSDSAYGGAPGRDDDSSQPRSAKGFEMVQGCHPERSEGSDFARHRDPSLRSG